MADFLQLAVGLIVLILLLFFVFGGSKIETEAECVIMKSVKQDILKSLDKLSGITEASMFPDFDGFARLHAHNKPYIESDIPR